MAKGLNIDEFTVEQKEKVIKQAFICGDTVLEISESPIRTRFTFNPLTGKRDRKSNTWYGVGRALKEPQKMV